MGRIRIKFRKLPKNWNQTSEFTLGVIMRIHYFTSKLLMIYSHPDINLIISFFSDGNEENEIAFAF